MQAISSRSNPKIKQARLLKQRKYRQETGLFLVEGIHHVGEAVEAAGQGRIRLDSIFYSPELLTSEFGLRLIADQSALGAPCYPTTPEVFASIAEKENPQGILAVVEQPAQELSHLNPENFYWGVALVAPQDPGNLGTILRTVDAVGAGGLLLLDSSVDPFHPNSVRASMGTIFWYPVISASFASFAAWCRRHGYHVYGTSAQGSLDYRELAHYERPSILLMGSEQKGLSPEQREVCEALLRLPMHGRSSSLNLAVATGVLLYDMFARSASPERAEPG